MRFIVVGTTGSGKTSFARRLAARLGCPHVEMDALHWGPDWTPRAPAEFEALIAAATQGERWVVDGNYSAVRHALWPRATHIIWLNYGRATIFARLLRRTLHRSLTRQPLWNDNRETLRQSFLSRKSILLWALQTYATNRIKFRALREQGTAGGDFSHLRWLEFSHPEEAELFLSQPDPGLASSR